MLHRFEGRLECLIGCNERKHHVGIAIGIVFWQEGSHIASIRRCPQFGLGIRVAQLDVKGAEFDIGFRGAPAASHRQRPCPRLRNRSEGRSRLLLSITFGVRIDAIKAAMVGKSRLCLPPRSRTDFFRTAYTRTTAVSRITLSRCGWERPSRFSSPTGLSKM